MRIVLPVGGLFSYCFYFNSNLMIIWWEDRKPLGNLHSILIMIVVAMCTYRDYTILDCFSISNNHTDGLSDELLWHGRSKNPYRTRCNRVSCATRVSLQCQSHNICTTYTPLCVFLRIYINMFWLLVMFRLRCLLNSSPHANYMVFWINLFGCVVCSFEMPKYLIHWAKNIDFDEPLIWCGVIKLTRCVDFYMYLCVRVRFYGSRWSKFEINIDRTFTHATIINKLKKPQQQKKNAKWNHCFGDQFQK